MNHSAVWGPSAFGESHSLIGFSTFRSNPPVMSAAPRKSNTVRVCYPVQYSPIGISPGRRQSAGRETEGEEKQKKNLAVVSLRRAKKCTSAASLGRGIQWSSVSSSAGGVTYQTARSETRQQVHQLCTEAKHASSPTLVGTLAQLARNNILHIRCADMKRNK